MYCIKCKSETKTKNKEITTSQNGRGMMKGTCQSCGGTKCKFVSNKRGGMYNANNKREYNHDVEEIPKKANYKKGK